MECRGVQHFNKIVDAVKGKDLSDQFWCERGPIHRGPIAPQLNVVGVAVAWPPA